MANPNQNNPFTFNQIPNINENPNDFSNNPQNYPPNPNQAYGFANFARPQAGSSSQPFGNYTPHPHPDSFTGLLQGNYPPQNVQYGNYPPQNVQYANYPPQNVQFGNYPPPNVQYGNYPPQNVPFGNYPQPNMATTPTTPTTPIYPTSSHGTNVNTATEDSDEEIVPDTQPEVDLAEMAIEKRRKSKKRLEPHPEEVFPGRAIKWDVDEILCLARCYLNISEDEIVGNAQRSDHFWLRVLVEFHKARGRKYRNRDMLISKWRETSKRLTAYSGIFSGLTRDSGCADGDKSEKARNLYKLQMGHVWGLDKVWQYCNNHEKWKFIESSSSQSSGSKRSRQTETSEASETAPQRRRPLGRGAAKKAARGGGSSSASQDESVARVQEHIDLQRKRLEIEMARVQELKIAKRHERDMQIINIDLNKFPEGEARDRMYAKQLEAMERLGLEM